MQVQLFVGTEKGAFVLTSDATRSAWSLEGPLFPGWKVTAVARDGRGGFVAATASHVYGAQVHRSADLRAWRVAQAGPAYTEASGFRLGQVWTLAEAGDVLYAGVDQAGLFASRDGGDTWRELDGLTGLPSRPSWFPGLGGLCAHHVVAGPGSLHCAISAVGVFASEDGGASWTSRNAGVPRTIEDEDHPEIGTCVHAIVGDPDDPRRLWRQDHRGMFRTEDGGATWRETPDGLPGRFGFPLVRHHASGALFAAPLASDEQRYPHGGVLRVVRSTDDGESWAPAGAPLAEGRWHAVLRQAMACDQLGTADGGVYLGDAGGGLWASRDLGERWLRLPGSLPRIYCVEAFVGA